MLAYILALAVALGSLAIYLAAFFFPEIHRKSDFIWSGVGLFYALVLWVCAGRITGGILLGQTASVALLGWFGWQTLTLRYSLTPPTQRTDIPSQAQVQEKLGKLSIPQKVGGLFTNLKDKAGETFNSFQQDKTKVNVKPDLKPSNPQNIKEAIANVGVVETSPRVTIIKSEVETPPVVVSPVEPEIKMSPSDSSEDLELVRPDPPPPELVVAAVEDAEAKHIPASPPDIADTEATDSSETSEANQPLENPPNLT